ncbi:hypothetical protein GGF46_005110 [Coemansia sp. RSA 552]|nr:hypothetical protein GGF46_005110 [Coemansia sp. RSA 552]
MLGLARVESARVVAVLLALASLTLGYTRTSTQKGVETNVYTTTIDGDVETLTSVDQYTSYIVFMNDKEHASVSSFVGFPATRTKKDGEETTYLSLVFIADDGEDKDKDDGDDDSDKDASQTDDSDSNSSDSGSTNIGPIIGGVVGGVLALVILGVVGWIYKRKHDRKKQLEEHQKEELQLLALGLDGSYKPSKAGPGPLSDNGDFGDTRNNNGSITDDLVSRYTGGSVLRNPPTLMESYSAADHPISIGTELTMDTQGRKAMPDGSPVIIDCLMPLRNAKISDYYADLEWFPFVAANDELMHHPGPSYIEEKELSHVATYLQKSSFAPGAQRRF